ncbi:MAG: hypothetical protein WBQ25_11865 [Nitrososphaeraceae archaeon]
MFYNGHYSFIFVSLIVEQFGIATFHLLSVLTTRSPYWPISARKMLEVGMRVDGPYYYAYWKDSESKKLNKYIGSHMPELENKNRKKLWIITISNELTV